VATDGNGDDDDDTPTIIIVAGHIHCLINYHGFQSGHSFDSD
jgi:hypothetical protein